MRTVEEVKAKAACRRGALHRLSLPRNPPHCSHDGPGIPYNSALHLSLSTSPLSPVIPPKSASVVKMPGPTSGNETQTALNRTRRDSPALNALRLLAIEGPPTGPQGPQHPGLGNLRERPMRLTEHCQARPRRRGVCGRLDSCACPEVPPDRDEYVPIGAVRNIRPPITVPWGPKLQRAPKGKAFFGDQAPFKTAQAIVASLDGPSCSQASEK